MKKIIMFVFVLILVGIGSVLALNCPPSLPKTFYGTVLYDNEILDGEFVIRALMNEDIIGSGEVSNGEYLIDVSPCFGATGQVSFIINGIEANEIGEFNGEVDWGKSVNLDLTVNEIPPSNDPCGNGVIDLGEECDGTNLAGRDINDCGKGWIGTISCNSNCEIDYSNCTAPYCGDGTCNNDESCSSCSADCGACSSGGGGSGGGGGGGGGSSGGSSSSSFSTTSISSSDSTNNENNDNKEIVKLSDTSQNNLESFFSKITGAVVGSGRIKFIIPLVFVVLIVVIGVGVYVKRK